MGYSIRLEGDVRRLMARMKQFSELDKRQVTAAMAEAMRTSTLDRVTPLSGREAKRLPPGGSCQPQAD